MKRRRGQNPSRCGLWHSQRSVTYEISKVLAVLKEELKDYLPMFLIIVSLMSGKIS